MRSWTRVYARLLRLLPDDMRQRFGPEMVDLFEARLEEAPTRRARWIAAWGGVVDVFRQAVSAKVAAIRTRGLSNLPQGIRQSARSLRRTPGFTFVAVATLGLGIGAATAMFSVLDMAWRQPLPFPESDRLVLGRATFGGTLNPSVSFPDYADYRDGSESLASLAAVGGGSGIVTITGSDEPVQARMSYATGDFFTTLDVTPHVGRFPTDPELPEQGTGGLVISYAFWQTWFGGSSDVLDRTLTVDGSTRQVLAVLPPGFRYTFDSDLWARPSRFNAAPTQRRYHNYLLVGRLAPGVSLDEARSEIDLISARLEEAYPETNRDKALQLDGLRNALAEDSRASLTILTGAIVLILLIACANVASLLMARSSRRRSELAVRTAIGASRRQILRHLLVESMLLALAAAAVGITVSVWLQRLILGFVSVGFVGPGEAGFSYTMLGIGSAVALGTFLLFGILPSIAAVRSDPFEELKQGTRRSSSTSGLRYRNGLVVLQVALSVVVLVGSGLLVRSFAALSAVDPGFAVDNILTGTVRIPDDDALGEGADLQFFQALKESIEALPGVEMVGMTTHVPILNPAGNVSIWPPGRPPISNAEELWADRRVVLPGYFESMDIALVEGRTIEPRDNVEGAPPVIVLNRTTAARVFPDASALGRQVAVDIGGGEGGLFEVVGIVEDHRLSSLAGEQRPAMFLPFTQWPQRQMSLTARTSTEPGSLVRPIQERIWELNRDIVLGQPQTMEDIVSASLRGAGSLAGVMTLFGAVALILVAMGLYGVLSFFVAQSNHEIGIRVAIGASGGRVLRLVLLRGAALVGAGLVLGAIGAIGATRLVRGMLYEISATDPLTFLAMIGLLVLITLSACLLPGWRAVAVDPLEALRAE